MLPIGSFEPPLGIVVTANAYHKGATIAERPHPDQQACRCARNRQGQVAARWPSATLDRRCAQQPI